MMTTYISRSEKVAVAREAVQETKSSWAEALLLVSQAEHNPHLARSAKQLFDLLEQEARAAFHEAQRELGELSDRYGT